MVLVKMTSKMQYRTYGCSLAALSPIDRLEALGLWCSVRFQLEQLPREKMSRVSSPLLLIRRILLIAVQLLTVFIPPAFIVSTLGPRLLLP